MSTIVNAAVIYWVLLLMLRILGRRGPNLMTPFELLIFLLMGGLGMQAILGHDHSLTNALTGICTIAVMQILVASCRKWSERFERIVDGTPVIVLSEGEWHRESMGRLRVKEQDVMAAARISKGIERVEQIKYAIVERNGGISIVKQEAKEQLAA